MLTIDGRFGEGGGQILRTALCLSLISGKSFAIKNLRAKRNKPGLLRQHLTALRAAVRVGMARCEGAELGRQRVVFEPQGIAPGHYHLRIGSAGSTTLVMQALLPALLFADGPSTVVMEGGTHNFGAPPFDFLKEVWGHYLNKLGGQVEFTLERVGFYPAGGGRIVAHIQPSKLAGKLDLVGKVCQRFCAEIMVAAISHKVASREATALRDATGRGDLPVSVNRLPEEWGPGNVILARSQDPLHPMVLAAFGKRSLSSEAVAADIAQQIHTQKECQTVVCEHLADQLPLLLSLADGGQFRVPVVSDHLLSQIHILEQFGAGRVSVEQEAEGSALVQVRPSTAKAA